MSKSEYNFAVISELNDIEDKLNVPNNERLTEYFNDLDMAVPREIDGALVSMKSIYARAKELRKVMSKSEQYNLS